MGELNLVTEDLTKMVRDVLKRDAREVFWHDKWWTNRYCGWMMYGGQWAVYASNKEVEEFKKMMKRQLKEMGVRQGNEYMREMRMSFGVVRKWDREWQRLH